MKHKGSSKVRLTLAFVCRERWEDMPESGDGRRHCGVCDRDVFDLAGKTAREAMALYREHGGDVCARGLYDHAANEFVWPLARAAAAGSLVALSACGDARTEPTMGDIAAPPVEHSFEATTGVMVPPPVSVRPEDLIVVVGGEPTAAGAQPAAGAPTGADAATDAGVRTEPKPSAPKKTGRPGKRGPTMGRMKAPGPQRF